MHWIIFGMIFILAQSPARHKYHHHYQHDNIDQWQHQLQHQDSINYPHQQYAFGVLATPLPPPDPSLTLINPYIRHWEPAQYDRIAIDRMRRLHDAERRRKKRAAATAFDNDKSMDYRAAEHGPANEVRLQFFAHDRQFNVILKEDPASVFSPDIEIENTSGPLYYDTSRVYTGTLEDDEDALVHGILTEDNLFDGTITTKLENFYIEPAAKYAQDHKIPGGVHSVVYKMSDVDMNAVSADADAGTDKEGEMSIETDHYCASERLRKKLKNEFKRRRKAEQQLDSDERSEKIRRKRWLPEELTESRNPPLPLDLDVPYNDDFNVYRSKDANENPSDTVVATAGGGFSATQAKNRNKNILINDFNPNSDFNLRNTYRNRNIITSNFDVNDSSNGDDDGTSSSRPSHKTHVEIITKNGATKKPNIIVNNYNPDVFLTNTNHHYNSAVHQQAHVRNDIVAQAADYAKSSYDRKITCMLYLQADHTFYQKMGSDDASIEAITRHVQRANVIYKNTDFNGDGKPDNITFMIKRIKVHNMNALKDPTYRFPGNYGVEKFLELFSEEDYDAFCLAYMFTYRDFEMGTLGLAWTGDLKNAGGVCEKNGHYRGSLKSLNTGIVTLLNYGKHVPPAVSHVTLAHEIGHNFGSPHDPEQCTPGGEDGNYIMFARATSGDKRNNNKFSPCSLKAIEPVLNAKARSAKGCFTEPQQAICGNGVVDPGEECDCGWEEDCTDSCCYPMSRHPRLDEKPCTLTPRASCSPSQGPCCTTSCVLKFGDKCRNDNGCRDPSFCDGHMPQCPPSINKPNKTICNKEFVCYMGECTGSICLAYGLESCQCLPGPGDPATKACELCCKTPGEDGQCKSSFEWKEVPFDVPDMFAKPGTPCNDYNGYCDVFQKCREVDPSGPLATLRKLLLSEESIASFKKWIQSNWYTVLLVLIAVIVLLILTTKLLGRGSTLKKKSVTIIHSATTETVRLPDDNNGVIVHTAIRTKVPFKKKVRGERKGVKSSTSKTKVTTSKTTPPSGGGTGGAPGIVTTTNPNATVTTVIPSGMGGGNNTRGVATKIKVFKRQQSSDSPKKALKKKKRVAAPVMDEEQNKTIATAEPIPMKTKNQKKSKSKHKEIIDYSKQNHSNTFGKVQKWLLESPIVAQASASASPAEMEHTSKVRNIMSKSQSTPERLAQRSPKKVQSVGNLNDKVKLQVVYKPPFKFSLKLSKNSAVKTKVIGAGMVGGRSKRKGGRIEKPTKETVSVPAMPKSSRRTALLVRTASTTDNNNDGSPLAKLKPYNGVNETGEPNYETLNSKRNSLAATIASPLYENVTSTACGALMPCDGKDVTAKKPEAINSATFRINKSVSGSNLHKHPQSHQLSHSNSNSHNSKNSNSRGSSSNIHQFGANSSGNHRNSSNDLSCGANTQFGSSQNLIRSSTTNLSKTNRNSFDIKRGGGGGGNGAFDVNRSSTTNLCKERRHGSHMNLHRSRGPSGSSGNLQFDEIPPIRSRKNSTNLKQSSPESTSSKTSIPRVPSNSNLKVPSLRRGSINNIPRANLKSNSFNQHSRFSGLPQSQQQQQQQSALQQLQFHNGKRVDHIRPHTADCTDGSGKPFDWTHQFMADKLAKDDPLPSDLEVMVSDVENLVNDV